MVFSSSIFLIYFLPVFLLLYFLADRRYKNLVALAASFIFLVWGAPVFTIVVLAMVAVDYLLGLGIARSKGSGRKSLLISGIILNIAVLLFFQYTSFFVDTVNSFFSLPVVQGFSWMKFLVPLGLSFITFHQISYLIDVHRETAMPMRNPVHYSLFILNFPQLINGPINRAADMAPQLADRSSQDTLDNKLRGAVRFIIGLSKKVLIANVLGEQVDRIFALGGADISTPLAWIAVVAYGFQIYFDFSGYTDMALGLGRMMGFVLPENFNSPYTATSMTDFWRRWHMSLSNWLRDYLFMPMSVSMRHAGKAGVIISILITFVICGMWHQPGWTFIVWGAWHGLWLALDQWFLLKVLKKTGRAIATIFTFVVTTVGWVFFRAETFDKAGFYLKRMFVYAGTERVWGLRADFWTVFAIAAVFSFLTALKPGRRLEEAIFEKNYSLGKLLILALICFVLLVLCLGGITGSGYIPFIYNRF